MTARPEYPLQPTLRPEAALRLQEEARRRAVWLHPETGRPFWLKPETAERVSRRVGGVVLPPEVTP